MKILMDSDCLIKITKAGLKELVCESFAVTIPSVVKVEVVDAGKEKKSADADIVEKNIKNKIIKVLISPSDIGNGDQALVNQFIAIEYDVVATDDAKLTRTLTAHNIPFVVPGILVFHLFEKGFIDFSRVVWALRQLSPFISREEYGTVMLLLERFK